METEFIQRQEKKDLDRILKLKEPIKQMDQSLLYLSLAHDQIDIGTGYNTDSQIEKYDFLVLKDDENIFPSYEAALVVNNQFLQDFPEIVSLLKKLSNSISEDQMRKMN